MFTEKDFARLRTNYEEGQLCVSIYIPTQRAGDNQKDQLTFKNALSDAVEQLTDKDLFADKAMTKQDALKFLSPAYELLDDDNYWLNLSDGLAVFISDGRFDHFEVPMSFNNFVFVGQKPYLRHLISLLNKDDKYFVLALSQNEVRFFEGRKHSITPVKIRDLVPNGMEDMISAGDSEQSLQAHSANKLIYHGHGGGADDKNVQLEKYFRSIDNGLMEMLHDESAPLVIYSVESQISMYKEISNYSNVYEVGVKGNPEQDDPVMIHTKTWRAVRGHFFNKQQEAQKRFNEELANDKASFSIHDIVPAAVEGKVEDLFVDINTDEVWGKYNESDHSLQIHETRQADSECLLNDTALTVYNNGGTVYNIPRMEFPRIVAQVNAIYRY